MGSLTGNQPGDLQGTPTGILQLTAGICNTLSGCSLPFAVIVKVNVDCLASYVGGEGESSGGGRVEQLNSSFAEGSGNLQAIKNQLATQEKAIGPTLDFASTMLDRANIKKIEAAYQTLLRGSHRLTATLDELKSFIYELNTAHLSTLNMERVQEMLEMVKKEKGNKVAKELGSYLVTVKAEYLIIVSLYYSYLKEGSIIVFFYLFRILSKNFVFNVDTIYKPVLHKTGIQCKTD